MLLGAGLVVTRAVSQAPAHPLQQALNLFNSGQYQQALVQLSPFVEEHPDSAGAQKLLGMTQFMLGKPAEAIATMLKAVRLAPQDADAWYYLGRLYFSKDNATDALAAFRRSLELNPAAVRTVNHLGQTYEALGRFPEAEKAYVDAIALEVQQATKYEWPYYNLGLLYMTHGKVDEAIPYFRQALGQNPRFTEAKIKLAVALSRKETSQEALDLLQEAVQLEPDNPEAHYRLGLLLTKTGRRDEGERELELFRKLKKR